MIDHSPNQDDRRRLIFEHLQNNNPRDALRLAKLMCKETPDDTEAWMLQAASHAALGNMNDVIHCCEQTLAVEPGHTLARHNLGIALGNIGATFLNDGQPQKAAEYLQRSVEFSPDNATLLQNLGTALSKTGSHEDAIFHLKRLLAIQPENASAYATIGKCLASQGDLTEAENAYKDAIRKDPSLSEAYNNLASILQTSGRLGEALSLYDKAITLNPTSPEIHYNKCLCLYFYGRAKDAIFHGLKAFNLAPGKLEIRQALAQAFNGYHGKADASWDKSLVDLFTDNRLDFQLLNGVASDLVLQRLHALFPTFTELSTPQLTKILVEHFTSGAITDTIAHPLFTALLTQTVCCTILIELFLTALRSAFMHIASDPALHLDNSSASNILDPACALACQCCANEYIYSLSDVEQENLDALLQTTTSLLHLQTPVDPTLQFRLATIACYIPLHSIDEALKLTKNRDETEHCFNLMLERQVLNYLQEQELLGHIDTLTPVTDATSELVREQYEDFPYPRWLSFSKLNPRPPQKVIGELFPWFSPPSFPTGKARILIAGCGTGRHAMITANRFSDCELLAVDLSASSLAYAMRMTNYYDVDNIHFAQADILKLASLNQTFHIIESVGVLHHMQDPVQGLKVLANLLEPDGLMNIGLYSKAGRRYILAAQQLLREHGGGSSITDIRAGRRLIMDLDSAHPAHDTMYMQDFYSASECRDLLLHVQEHCYEIAEIEDMLAESDLEFIGFEFQDPAGKLKFQSVNHAPHDLGSLHKWKLFEQNNPDTFLEMYTFWCRKTR